MNRYLVCYDYGMGGIWYWVEAPSVEVVRGVFPHFFVFEHLPDWWTARPLTDLPTYTIGQPMDVILQTLVDEAARKM